MVKVQLHPVTKRMKDREILEKLIIALADHPGMGYYLQKHGLIVLKEG